MQKILLDLSAYVEYEISVIFLCSLGGSDRGYNWKIFTILGFLVVFYVLITLVNRVFLHLCGKISPKIFEVDMFDRQKSLKSQFSAKMTLWQGTVGCVWNFQIGGGCKSAIFQHSYLKFDTILYFGLINSPTVAKIFSCKNGVLSQI